MDKNFYSVHYRLNGKEQNDRLWADSYPKNLSKEEFNDSIVKSLKRTIGYDSSNDKLDILGIEPILR